MAIKHTVTVYICDSCGKECDPSAIKRLRDELGSPLHLQGQWAIDQFDICGFCWTAHSVPKFVSLITKIIQNKRMQTYR